MPSQTNPSCHVHLTGASCTPLLACRWYWNRPCSAVSTGAFSPAFFHLVFGWIGWCFWIRFGGRSLRDWRHSPYSPTHLDTNLLHYWISTSSMAIYSFFYVVAVWAANPGFAYSVAFCDFWDCFRRGCSFCWDCCRLGRMPCPECSSTTTNLTAMNSSDSSTSKVSTGGHTLPGQKCPNSNYSQHNSTATHSSATCVNGAAHSTLGSISLWRGGSGGLASWDGTSGRICAEFV